MVYGLSFCSRSGSRGLCVARTVVGATANENDPGSGGSTVAGSGRSAGAASATATFGGAGAGALWRCRRRAGAERSIGLPTNTIAAAAMATRAMPAPMKIETPRRRRDRRRAMAAADAFLSLDLVFRDLCPGAPRPSDIAFVDAAALFLAGDHQRAIADQVDHARHAAEIECRSKASGVKVTDVDARATHSRCVT